MKFRRSIYFLAVPLLSLAAVAQSNAPAPVPQADQTREIWDTGFRQKRPASQHAAVPKAAYAAGTAAPLHKPGAPSEIQAAIGFTIWRLRAPQPGDREGARILLQDLGPKSAALVPERISDSTPLHVDDRIRLSLEVPRSGFLYIIDREQYGDGSTGDPVLIFPTRNMSGGNNEVAPGRVVEIPPQNSAVRALRLTRSSDRQTGEDLIVIVAPSPLPEISAVEGEQTLPASQVNAWDRTWGVSSLSLNLVGGLHQTWSAAEQQAGRSPESTLLTQTDPLPQTILGTLPRGSGQPLLVHIPLILQ